MTVTVTMPVAQVVTVTQGTPQAVVVSAGSPGAAGTPGAPGAPGDPGAPGTPGTQIYTGANAYDAGLLAAVRTGDLFVYDDGGAHPGWLYRWNGTDWDYAGNLKGQQGDPGSPGDPGPAGPANLAIGTTAPTPATGAQVLWLQDLGGGDWTFNLVTGD